MPCLAADLNLMPWPAHVSAGKGALVLDGSLTISVHGGDQRVTRAVLRFVAQLRRQTGTPFDAQFPADSGRIDIVSGAPGAGVQQLGEDESYTLTVDDHQARLRAPNPLGILRGLETLRQLVQAGEQDWIIPAMTIEDRPRFPWRGLMIDVSRHFMPVDAIRRNLDGMEAAKLNVLHLHLSDDQGFRVESLRYPRLQQMGSDGLFYTQEQIRELVAYARDRGIRIVPEFDMPGHATSWLVGYPELASAPGPYRIAREWSIHTPCIDPTGEHTYEFLDGFIGEMAALFPDAFFHIGGDEVNGEQWNASAHIQAWMREHGVKDNGALQAYFNQRVQAIVSKHGKRMEGWDEILDASLPKDILIQSWRGQKSLAEAAQQGFTGILSSGYYLDHMEKAATHYAVDPMSKECAGLTEEQKKFVLGGESCMWGEYVTPENIDGRIWPRNAVIAERLWSPASLTDPESMYRRMESVSRDLEFAGLLHRANYRLMCERLAGSGPVEPVRVFADVAEAGSLGVRAHAHKYSTDEPLNRLPDTVLPESDTARHFGELVEHVKDAQAAAEIRQWLVLWRDNDAKLEPIIAQSALLKGEEPASQTLMDVAKIGLQALSAIEEGKALDAQAAASYKTRLVAAGRPVAEVRIAVVAPIQTLVNIATK